jgi:hypothetical protein
MKRQENGLQEKSGHNNICLAGTGSARSFRLSLRSRVGETRLYLYKSVGIPPRDGI